MPGSLLLQPHSASAQQDWGEHRLIPRWFLAVQLPAPARTRERKPGVSSQPRTTPLQISVSPELAPSPPPRFLQTAPSNVYPKGWRQGLPQSCSCNVPALRWGRRWMHPWVVSSCLVFARLCLLAFPCTLQNWCFILVLIARR